MVSTSMMIPSARMPPHGYTSQASATRAAKVAAASPHALVNLVRLIKAIEGRAPDAAEPGDSPVLNLEKREDEVRKDRENLIYARSLLDALSGQNEQASNTSQTLDQLRRVLDSLDLTYSEYTSTSSEPLSRMQSRGSTTVRAAPVPTSMTAVTSESMVPLNSDRPSVVRQRKPRSGQPLSAYLAKRQREDAQGGEAGLLRLAETGRRGDGAAVTGSVDAEKQREELLAGNTSRVAISGAQLHEELGGQLAQMSHRLKLNALHFANSLEEEKAILETSQAALEGNLAATQSSKTQLSAVTRKGRGTTCMSIGIVLLVLIIFVWTYMLIRFT